MAARIVGIGHSLCGDDGVGLAVVRRLRAIGSPSDVELLEAPDPASLLLLLETTRPVIIVDAFASRGPPGTVIELDAAELHDVPERPLSSHGISLAEVVELARTLFGGSAARRVRLVGVGIALPVTHGSAALTAPVAGAVERAARVVLARVHAEPP